MEKWIENVFVLMRRHKIRQSEIAEKYGCAREHINRILNGTVKVPDGAEARIKKAIQEIIEEKGK
ncbi:MAG: hypothetical protein IK954_02490 [Clostridia bacterium]|nr:hypothetical protein [Clostridia bacterium]